jgi:hypothetical protein
MHKKTKSLEGPTKMFGRVHDELLFILSFCAKIVLTRAKQYYRMYQPAMMSIDESSNLLKNPPPNSPNRI